MSEELDREILETLKEMLTILNQIHVAIVRK